MPHWSCSERLFSEREHTPKRELCPAAALGVMDQEWSETPAPSASSGSALTLQILWGSPAVKLGHRECPGSGVSSPLSGVSGWQDWPGSILVPVDCLDSPEAPPAHKTLPRLFPAHKTLLKLFQRLQVSWLSPRCQSRLPVFHSRHTGIGELLAAPENVLEL